MYKDFELKEGYILFQDLDQDSTGKAIEKVTKTSSGYNFSHVGIVIRDNDTLKVLEAISEGVMLTTLDNFFDRSLNADKQPKVVAGKLKEPFTHFIPLTINEGKKLTGLPYDHVYQIGDSAYYCSELIYEIFHRAAPGQNVFELQPMTFKDSNTGETVGFWKEYYKKLNYAIPEGEPGINPNGMSVSPAIDLVYDYATHKRLE